MVDAEQDVLDAEPEIGGGDREPARRGRHDEGGLRRRQPRRLRVAVQPLEAHQHVGAARGEPVDARSSAGQPAGHAARVQRST